MHCTDLALVGTRGLIRSLTGKERNPHVEIHSEIPYIMHRVSLRLVRGGLSTSP